MESLDPGIGRVLDVLVGGAERGPALALHLAPRLRNLDASARPARRRRCGRRRGGAAALRRAVVRHGRLVGQRPARPGLRGERDVRAWLASNAGALRSVTGPELADAFGGLVPQAWRERARV